MTASVRPVRNSVVLFSIVAVALVGGAGCKGKPKRQNPPAQVGGSGAGSDKMRPAPDLMLPRADGTPPKKTTKAHTKADYEKLAKLEYPGFTAEVRTVGEKVFEVRHKTKDHPRLWAVVTIQPCFDCMPMELDKWKAKTEELKAMNLEVMKDAPDVTFEVGEAKLYGQSIIYTYQVGVMKGDGEGGGSFSFTNNYVAYFNDGINQIKVVGAYKDDPTSKEELMKLAPKVDLQALALSFLDVYTHAW